MITVRTRSTVLWSPCSSSVSAWTCFSEQPVHWRIRDAPFPTFFESCNRHHIQSLLILCIKAEFLSPSLFLSLPFWLSSWSVSCRCEHLPLQSTGVLWSEEQASWHYSSCHFVNMEVVAAALLTYVPSTAATHWPDSDYVMWFLEIRWEPMWVRTAYRRRQCTCSLRWWDRQWLCG